MLLTVNVNSPSYKTNPSSSDDADGDDDASEEGAAVRNLFKITSSSSSDSATSSGDDDNKEQSCVRKILKEQVCCEDIFDSGDQKQPNTSVQLMMDNVKITQPNNNSRISEIVWPAASFLASFVIDFYNEFSKSSNNSSDNKEDNSSKGKQNTPSTFIYNNYSAKVKQCYHHLQHFFSSFTDYHVLELGAGLGLTGLKVAMTLPCRVYLTDLDEAMPLLKANTQLNYRNFVLGPSAVTCLPLPWGVLSTSISSILYNNSFTGETANTKSYRDLSKSPPLLVLASDCVYYEELHLPLEETLVSILSENTQSICLLAGMRRWKRDNTFYSKLGRRTRTGTHSLECTCIHELVERKYESSTRNIIRIYAVRWVDSAKAVANNEQF